MKPLYVDQIHAPAFQKLCDYIWSPNPDCGYVNSVINEHNPRLKIINENTPPDEKTGIVFVGMCQAVETCFESLPADGRYIVVHRTNDRPFRPDMYIRKTAGVKHIYTVDNRIHAEDVTAIPFGLASINGEDHEVKRIFHEVVAPANTKVFCRYNVNRDTFHRNESLPILRGKPFVKLIEEQIPADDFYRQVKAHKFTMALAGCGADASRQWAAIILGSIPIVTDCVEMRFFEDLPMVFCPHNMNEITEEWLDAQEVSGKSTERMRMSYWENQLLERRKTL